MRRVLTRRLGAVCGLALAGSLAAGCGSSGNGGTDPGQTPAIAISLTASSASIQQGESSSVNASLSRSGGFTGTVNLTVEGVPTGVTADVSNIQTSGGTTTATVTIHVAAATAPGVYNLTVRGTGSGVSDATAPFSLTVTAAPTPDYSLAVNPTTVPVDAGGTGQATVTINRTSFTGAVTLSLGNAPSGVTATFAGSPTTGTSSVATITVGAAVPAGTYQMAVNGTASVGDRTVPLSLTVTVPATGSYTLTGNPVSGLQNTQQTTTVAINRVGGFTGAVTLSATDVPQGLAVNEINPATTTGNGATVKIAIGANKTPGTYSIGIKGTAAGLPDQATTIAVTVTTNGSGNSTVDFTQCNPRPIWFAYQDGDGPWTVIPTPANFRYKFDINAAKGAIAYVTSQSSNQSMLTIQNMTKAEFTASTISYCGVGFVGKSASGTVAGLIPGDFGQLALGGGTATATVNGPVAFNGIHDGAQDLIGWRHPITGSNPVRGFARRDVNLANNGSLGTIDFEGAESFLPGQATITPGGLVGGEALTFGMTYWSGASCSSAGLYTTANVTPGPFAALGFPSGLQRASDYHQLFITAVAGSGTPITGLTGARSVLTTFHSLADRTIQLPAPVGEPTVTTLTGPYKRLQGAFAIPAEFNTGVTFQYSTISNPVRFAIIGATAGWVNGSSVTLAMPDFSSLSGWTNDWMPGTTATGTYGAYATGGNITGGAICQEGGRLVTSYKLGTF